jgi:hypothetical protein
VLQTATAGQLVVVQTLTDADGDSVTSAGLDLGTGDFFAIEDDGPVFTSAVHGDVGNVANSSVTENIIASVGTDEPGSFGFGSNSPGDLTSDGKPVLYSIAGNTLTAFADTDLSGTVNDGDTPVFTLMLNSDATYTFTLLQPLDAFETVSIGASTSFGSGPTESQRLSESVGTTPLAILSSPGASVNGSTAGWGVTNNNFDEGETILVDFGDDDFTNTEFSGPPVQFATVEFTKYKAGDKVEWFVKYTDGSTGSGDWNFTQSDETRIFGVSNKFIDYIEFTDVIGAGKFDLVSVGTLSNTGTLDLNFNINISDGDGDTDTGMISVTVDGSAAALGGTATNNAIAGDGGANTLDAPAVYAIQEEGSTATATDDAGDAGDGADDDIQDDGSTAKLDGTATDDAGDGDGGANTLNDPAGNDDLSGGADDETQEDGSTAKLDGTATDDAGDDDGGANTLNDPDGNDILEDGAGSDETGSDTLTDGPDGTSDRFVFESADLGDGVDNITDFTLGLPAEGGDVLDISDLLAGEGIDPSAVDFNLADYLVVTGGTDSTIAFDGNGTVDGHGDAVQIATLQGVATDLNTLLGNNQVDHTV